MERNEIYEVFGKRCAQCHESTHGLGWNLPNDRHFDVPMTPRMHDFHLFNLTEPVKSWLLMAPLAKAAGGNGSCRDITESGTAKPIFADTNDSDYRKLLTIIKSAGAELDAIKRYDMPGFKPHPAYIHHLKRFGVLPNDFDIDKEQLDCFEADEAYYRSLWYKTTSDKANE